MDTVKTLTTEAMQEIEDGNLRDGLSLLVDAIEDLSATVEATRERDVVVEYYSEFRGAEVTD